MKRSSLCERYNSLKTMILKISALLLLVASMSPGCKKEKIEYDDESIGISTLPNISIYKTNSDYFYNIPLVNLNGQVSGIPTYTANDPSLKINSEGKLSSNFRWRLKDGYIIDEESYINRVFTDITFEEYIDYNTANKVTSWPITLIESRIIDKNPFVEYYYYDGVNKAEKIYTLGEINKMIENGTLESVFKKLK